MLQIISPFQATLQVLGTVARIAFVSDAAHLLGIPDLIFNLYQVSWCIGNLCLLNRALWNLKWTVQQSWPGFQNWYWSFESTLLLAAFCNRKASAISTYEFLVEFSSEGAIRIAFIAILLQVQICLTCSYAMSLLFVTSAYADPSRFTWTAHEFHSGVDCEGTTS